MTTPIYLDHNATTPVAGPVVAAMARALEECYGNPSSPYRQGQEAAAQLSTARESVARLIGASVDSLVMTGCATEANNLALLGVAAAAPPNRRHLVVSAVEHPAVMEPARHLETQGWELSVVPVDAAGRVAVDEVMAAMRPDTALVSIMLANNEVGTLQPLADIAARLAGSATLLHTDAAQAVGKVPVDVEALGVDLLTLAGHKFQASKGIGALHVRPGTPIRRILFGAGHEHGLRPGTENVPAIVGLGAAAELAAQRLAAGVGELQARRDRLHEHLRQAIPGLALNGHETHRLPNTLNVSFPGVEGRALLKAVEQEVAASVGSACHADQAAPSGVLGAMGLTTERALGAVRLSVGWDTPLHDIDRAAETLVDAWRWLGA
ncbi:MAG: cysteine desulfurase family protein [Pseudomonadota bacterium]